jgi:hypothetical protein
MKARWKWAGAAVVTVVVGALGYMQYKGFKPAEVAELLAEEGERVLREPLRPVRGAPRVLVFALDGVGEDELLDAVASGRAPQLATLLGRSLGDGVFEHGYAATNVLSVLPSTTLAAWSSVFTGAPPAETGVPGNEFFIREQLRYVAPAPVSSTGHEDVLRVYNDDLIGSVLAVPTLYERANVRTHVALSHLYRGADVLILPELSDFVEIAAAMAAGLTGDDDPESGEYAELDDESVEMSIEAMAQHGVPDLQVIYFPGVDLYTHVAREPLARQREYVTDVIDPAIARVLEAYRAAGALEDTYIVFVSDHGHTPVLDDDRHALGSDGDDEPTSLIERAGYRLRDNAVTIDTTSDFQAAVAYQGALAYVYVADRSTCAESGTPCDWARPPRLEEDVLPLVRAFDAANRTGALVPELRGTLDLIFARAPTPTGSDALPFEVWDGTQLVPVADWLAANPRPDLPELDARLRGLGAGPYGHRAGDILLLTRSGAHRPIEDRFYFSGRYRSWHGSPESQDSRIALVVAGGGRSGTELRDVVGSAAGATPTQLDVTRIILALLGR